MENPEVEIKARNPVPVQITVLRGRNLKGSKIDSPMSYIRADFNNIHLGDSGKFHIAEGEIEYNFTTNFDCSFDGIQGLDNLVHKPVILTVIEVFPKEKKKKDEKTVVFGQATVDLLPLVQGECMFSKTVAIHPLGGAPLEQTASDEIKVLLEVTVSVPEPLLSEAQLEASNLLRITAESAYSVPESWNPTGPQFNYTVAPFLPGAPQKVIFSNGILKAAGEKEISVRPKRWPISNIVAFGAQNIPDSFIEVSPYEDEDGELNSKEDWAFRTEAENLKKRVTWNIERRCFMEPEALSSLQKHIADTAYLPVEVKRVPLTAPTKGGKGSKIDKAEDEGPISFHGIAYINMAPLLYPGVRRIRGAYPIVAYNEAEIFEKTKRKKSFSQETPGGKGHPQHHKMSISKPKDERTIRETGRKSSVNVKSFITEHGFEHEASNSLNVEGDQYAETRTYIVLEFSLTKPLVQKRLREDLAQRIAEMIPPRPLFPRRTSGAEKAVTDYHNQIINVARVIMDEYQEMFGQKLLEGKLSNEFQDQEERKQKLIFELNNSGKYFAFKEQLKHAVVKIVREKYLRTVAFEDREQLQTFLNELYIYLVDQMHCCLHKMLHVDPPDPIPESFLGSAQLKHFAKEAEAGKNFELAKKYHLERLARDKSNPDHWFDYGTFYLLLNDYVRAEECFREAIAVDQEHINSLILCGTLACMNEYYKEADNFFESARCFEPNSILAWTMHGLFYESQDQTILAEMAFSEAKKLQLATETLKKSLDEVTVDKAKITKVPETEPKEDKKDPQIASVQSEPVISDSISAQSIATPEAIATIEIPKSDSSTSQKRKSIDEESKQSTDPIDSPLITKQQEPVPTLVIKQPPKGTISQFTRSIYMQTAMFLLEVNALQFVSRALAHELICSESGLSCEYQVVLARLHMQQGEFGKAEECLAEAERINHQNPDLWALLGHLSYMKEDYAKAKEFYARTVSYVNDAFDMHAICLRLGSMYLLENEIESYKSAKSVYLFASQRAPSCLTWLGVGIACYRLNEFTDAEDALSEANILCNSNAEVWGYLTLVCLKTGRKFEAEQTYKYASKLNLEDKRLLDEIHQLQQTVGFGNPSL
ncbi:cilia- and flagella-associated protein 70 isoform X2 [Hypanus sabinus]|uniref:cilia- and flagella-associated protein 70 isoform X2 n=1 Tax=Hypanus sabinus TaxID=79690 RepID=UPI0028C490E5|nr:cilia- and flagella-associated protein 70 isoform X2 [Hypanus sabinus]XP_059835277.1 cilia- and flagella-associated protein 70 isoform X2 [Hypanus sabinus]